MKTFQLIHISQELGARSILLNEETLLTDVTTPIEDRAAAMAMKVGDRILYHFGSSPVKTGNLIRKS